MAEPASRSEQFGAPITRPAASKFNMTWLVMLAAGLIAFVLFFAATSQNKGTVTVLVANRTIASGEKFQEGDYAQEQIHVQGKAGDRLLVYGDNTAQTFNGRRATRVITKGSFLLSSDFADLKQDQSTRWVSFAINPADAVAGDINIGDNVDLFDKCGVEVGHRLSVVDKQTASNSSLSSSGDSKITFKVSVPDAQIANVVRLVLTDKFSVVLNNNTADLRPANYALCGSGGN